MQTYLRKKNKREKQKNGNRFNKKAKKIEGKKIRLAGKNLTI